LDAVVFSRRGAEHAESAEKVEEWFGKRRLRIV
jgi:hypothetical protein